MKIGFIGTGAMGTAIVRGAVAQGATASDFILTDRNMDAAMNLAEELGMTAVASNTTLAAQADLIILGVKPHIQQAVIREIEILVRLSQLSASCRTSTPRLGSP